MEQAKNSLEREAADTIEALQRENAALKSAIARQARIAKSGMDAAKSHAHLMLEQAEKIRAESTPDLVASERAANAALTDEVLMLQRELARLNNHIESYVSTNAELRRELEEAKQREEGLRGIEKILMVKFETAQAENTELQRELGESKMDAVMLDFLERHPTAVIRSTGYLGSPDSWRWRDEHGAAHDAASLRDALGWAIAANKG